MHFIFQNTHDSLVHFAECSFIQLLPDTQYLPPLCVSIKDLVFLFCTIISHLSVFADVK